MTLRLLRFHSKKLALATNPILNAPLLWSSAHRNNPSLVTRFASSSLSPEKQRECDERQSFTVSYLVDSCGLSPERALSLSRHVKLESPRNPDSVLDLLRTHGLTGDHISRLVRWRPTVLLADPQKTLLPKLEKLLSIGISRADLGSVVSKQPAFLGLDLESEGWFCVDFLKNDVGLGYGEIVKVLRTGKRIVSCFRTIAPNMAFLREIGMPRSSLSVLVSCHPGVLCLGPEKFLGCFNKAVEKGYDPVKSSFIHALTLFSELTESTRERKMGSYRRWGWSEHQIQVAVRKYPQFMCTSEEKFELVMDFLVNKVGWQAADCVRAPWVFNYSFEKRIKPRYSVFAVLLSKGLVKKPVCLGNVANITEKHFLNKFVTKYRHDIPELVDVYEGRIGFPKLGLGC